MRQPFEGVLGNNSELRTLDFLLPLRGMEFNITELSEEIQVSRVTATRVAKKFEEWGVFETRMQGAIRYYKLNDKSSIVECIQQFNNLVTEQMLGTEALYEIHDYIHSRLKYPKSQREEEFGLHWGSPDISVSCRMQDQQREKEYLPTTESGSAPSINEWLNQKPGDRTDQYSFFDRMCAGGAE